MTAIPDDRAISMMSILSTVPCRLSCNTVGGCWLFPLSQRTQSRRLEWRQIYGLPISIAAILGLPMPAERIAFQIGPSRRGFMSVAGGQTRKVDDASAGARYDVDVLVIGGGPAGTWAAISAAARGAKVVLADK